MGAWSYAAYHLTRQLLHHHNSGHTLRQHGDGVPEAVLDELNSSEQGCDALQDIPGGLQRDGVPGFERTKLSYELSE